MSHSSEYKPSQTYRFVEGAGEIETAADTGELLDRVQSFITRYVEFASDHQAVAATLWVAHSHAVEASFTTPYLAVLSAEKRSGKTTLLRVLAALCARSLKAASISEAALFRTIEEDSPTLFLDEVDALFGGSSERSEPLRALLDAGNARDECAVIRCIGNQHRRHIFNVFCPKVLAGLDNARFPDTIRDRSIVLRLRRGELGSTEWWLPQDALPPAEVLHDALVEWAREQTEALKRHRPVFPSELHARAAEGWWPLLSIADLAGGACRSWRVRPLGCCPGSSTPPRRAVGCSCSPTCGPYSGRTRPCSLGTS